MANYALRIGDTPEPDWRLAMTATNTLYYLTTQTPLTPLGDSIVWPGGSRPTRYGNATTSLEIHYSYGSAVWVEDIGVYGAHVYTGTGEDVFADQMSYIALDADAPTWAWWQQPYYALTSGEASSSDADWYYDPTAADAVPSSRQITITPGVGYTINASWDGTTFPLALPTSVSTGGGWLLGRKAERTMGNNRALAMRYNAPCYIPPSFTGTGAGAILTNDDTFGGPLLGNNGKPANVDDPGFGAAFTSAQFCSETWPSGNQKLWIRAQNTQTKEWTILTGAALDAPRGGDVSRGDSFVDYIDQRVYYRDGHIIYYIDFADGLALATRSSYTTCTVNNTPSFLGVTWDYNAASLPIEKHPTKKLLYIKNRNPFDSREDNGLLLYDLAAGQMYVLDMQAAGLDFTGRGDIGAGYDPTTNTAYFVGPNAANNAVKYWSFQIPSDPTDVANYTVSTTTLSLASGVTLESINDKLHFGRHCQVLGDLGVIIWQQRFDAPLAFRVR